MVEEVGECITASPCRDWHFFERAVGIDPFIGVVKGLPPDTTWEGRVCLRWDGIVEE